MLPSEIGDIGFPPRALEQYAVALESVVDVEAIGSAGFKVVVDYSYGSTSFVMANVFSKLGAEVLAVNPYVSTQGVVEFDREAHAAQVGNLVRASGANLGAVIDPSGERLTLIDDRGHVLSTNEALLAMLTLVRSRIQGDRVALPVSVTMWAAEILAEAGIHVLPTKTSSAALMVESTAPGVGFAADLNGGFIVPGFLPAFDGAASLVKVLDLLAHAGGTLSEIVEGLPRIHMAHERVITPWEQKGMVMRTLVEHSADRQLELVDGVKVHHEGAWALALPDPEEPITHIWAEAGTEVAARQLAEEYARRIRQMLR